MKKELNTRMYFLTDYHISGIQKGIQSGHAAVEYLYEFGIKYLENGGDKTNPVYKQLVKFCREDKTFILLNGGSSTYNLEEYAKQFRELGIPFAEFREPALNNALTAISYIADEQVWNKKLYPNFEDWRHENEYRYSAYYVYEKIEEMSKGYKEFIGGDKNVYLRRFNTFDLAPN